MAIEPLARPGAAESWATAPASTCGLSIHVAPGLVAAILGPGGDRWTVASPHCPDLGLFVAGGHGRFGEADDAAFAIGAVILGGPGWAIGRDPGHDIGGIPYLFGDPADPLIAIAGRHGFDVRPAACRSSCGDDHASAGFSIEAAGARLSVEGVFRSGDEPWQSPESHMYGFDEALRPRWKARESAVRRRGTATVTVAHPGSLPVSFETPATLDHSMAWEVELDPVVGG